MPSARRRRRKSWSCRRAGPPGRVPGRRWYIGLAAAAALFGLMIGGAGTYVGIGLLPSRHWRRSRRSLPRPQRSGSGSTMPPATYKLAVNAGDGMLVDVPASNDPREALQRISQNLPQSAASRSEALGPDIARRPSRGRRGTPGGAARLCHRQQGARSGDPGHLRLEAARSVADDRTAAGCQPALLAAIRAAPMRSSGRPISAISGASPTTSPGNCGHSRLPAPRLANHVVSGPAQRRRSGAVMKR